MSPDHRLSQPPPGPARYTGKVSVGGPAAERELPEVVIGKMAVGSMDNNVYLIRCKRSGRQIMIDAASEPNRLVEWLGHSELDGIITTHRHRDHWGALESMVRCTGARTYAHDLDADSIELAIDALVGDGDFIEFGDGALEVLHVPGHTPGSIILCLREASGSAHLFTGDTLFPGGVGAVNPPGTFQELFSGVVSNIFDAFDDSTWVYPGHGFDTTLGAERPALGEWRERGW